MDPLSITASIAGLASLALEVSHILHRYYSDVESASKDVADLIREVEALSKVLGQLEAFLEREIWRSHSFDQTASVLASTLKDCKITLNNLEKSLSLHTKEGFAKVLGKLLWPFRKEQVQKMIESLTRYNQIFQFSLTVEGCGVLLQTSEAVSVILQLQLDTSRRLHDIMKNISTLSEPSIAYLRTAENLTVVLDCIRAIPDHSEELASISAGVGELRLQAEEEKDVKILEWLSPRRGSRRHHEVRAKRAIGTGKWMLELSIYRDWIRDVNSPKFLWCVGMPGAGKTTLMSLIVDELSNTLGSKEVGIAYVYCDYRAQESQTLSLVTADILRQLLAQQSTIPSSLRTLFERSRRNGNLAMVSEILEILREVCLYFNKCFILIDAIDEFDVKNTSRMKEFLQIMDDLASIGAKFFITSRGLPDSPNITQNANIVNVSAHEGDIKVYVSQMLSGDAEISELLDDDLKMEIVNKIASQSRGMFLLPVLQTQAILGQVTRSDIRKTLDVLSVDISEAYNKAFQAIQGLPRGQLDIATKALLWITYAKRQLRIMELRYALGTRVGDKYMDKDSIPVSKSIIKSCLGLVSLENESGEVRLIHFTLQHYIRDQQWSLFSHAESFIAQICLTCLLFEFQNQEDNGSIGNPLLNYAMEHWGDHARNAPTEEIESLALRFLTDTSKLQQLYKTNKEITGLHITSIFGLSALCLALIQRGESIDARDVRGETPLHVASTYGQLEIARILLVNGANVNACSKAFVSPLFIAMSTGGLKIAELLVEHGAAINMHGKDFWTALHKAADCGYYECTELLLRQGAHIDARSLRGQTALHRAAGRGYVNIVEQLLNSGASIDAVTEDGWTPLHGACSSGRYGVVKLLLDRGANIHHCSADGRSSLHRACRGGYLTTTEILLEHGANVMVIDSYGSLALHRAAKAGHDAIIQLLLQKLPEQLLVANLSGRTARSEARINGYHKTEELLLKMESSLLGLPYQEQSDLERAIERQDEEKIYKLLSENVDIEAPSSNGLRPLHQALISNTYNIALALLQNGADANATTAADGWTPLHYAALKGNVSAVHLCIDHGALINTRNKGGQTALHKACQSGDLESVKLLLLQGADIEAADDWGWRPLHKAASHGHETILKTLLEHGAMITARTKDDRSLQACAASGGHHALVEFLRDVRVERHIKKWTGLHSD